MRQIAAIVIGLLLQTGCIGTRNVESVSSQGVGLSSPVNPQVAVLQTLRQRHLEARATFAETQDYHIAYRESIESARALIVALLDHWLTLPADDASASVIRKEIETVFTENLGRRLTERQNLEKSFIARAAWPILTGAELRPEQAAFIAGLTKPQRSVRINDMVARVGRATESLGWDVQAAYALALIRSGNNKLAGDEIDILDKKVSINLALNADGKLDYGLEAGAERYRSYTDYLQLCAVLNALQAAMANDREGASTHLENARQLRETFSSQAAPLVREVAQRGNVR